MDIPVRPFGLMILKVKRSDRDVQATCPSYEKTTPEGCIFAPPPQISPLPFHPPDLGRAVYTVVMQRHRIRSSNLIVRSDAALRRAEETELPGISGHPGNPT